MSASTAPSQTRDQANRYASETRDLNGRSGEGGPNTAGEDLQVMIVRFKILFHHIRFM